MYQNICAVLVWFTILVATLGNKIQLYFSCMEHYCQLLYCVRTDSISLGDVGSLFHTPLPVKLSPGLKKLYLKLNKKRTQGFFFQFQTCTYHRLTHINGCDFYLFLPLSPSCHLHCLWAPWRAVLNPALDIRFLKQLFVKSEIQF